MDEGAVAVIDALGFKDIWRRGAVRKDEAGFIAALRQLETRAAQRAAEWGSTIFPFSHKALFLSDTLVIATVAHLERSGRPGHGPTIRAMLDVAVTSCALFVAHVIRLAAEAPLSLSFRGCITVGKFVVDGPFLMGPATDQAATLHQHAEGALVWLAPSALQAVEDVPGGHARGATIPWSVPMKGGNAMETRVVSPFLIGETAAERASISEKILATFEPGLSQLDVWIKRQNTRAFLTAASKVPSPA